MTPGWNTMWCCSRKRLAAVQLLVEAAERRAAIAADVARGVVAGGEVALALQHRQADQRLDPGQIDPAGLLGVLVVEADLSKRHAVHPQMPRGFAPAGAAAPFPQPASG